MNKNELTNYSVLNNDTGEIIQDLTKSEVEYLKRNYTTIPQSRVNDCSIPDKDLFKLFIKEEIGEFYFYYYSKDIPTQHIFRFLYLCTFMNYKNYIELGNARAEGRLMKRKDLFEILKLSQRETYNTLNFLLDNRFIELDDEYIKINNKICIKGKIDKKKEVVRMFDKGIREIYEKSKPKEHKKLALLIGLLPYVNFKTNVVCKNPTEDIPELVVPITLTELANKFGYSTTQKLKKGLVDMKVNGEPVLMITQINNNKVIVVNPRIYYKGNNLDGMQGIINLFKIAQ
nr:MAG TPA: hypothetical protein [Caudoviricetes sp.]